MDSFPDLAPSMKLTGPEAISGNVAFVKAEQLCLDHFNESFAIRCLDLSLVALMFRSSL